jgi:DNA-binding SARP family transcriptional activator
MSTSRVLRARLLPPRLPGVLLGRDELVGRVLAGLEGRLVVVTAGAGHGKSTVLAQAVARCERPWVWLSLDDRASRAPDLVAHLGAAIAVRVPGFGAGLARELDPERLVRSLVREIASTVSDDLVLVLDDVHVLQGATAAGALDLLVHDLPPSLHLAVASRSRIPVSLARLGPAGVVEIGEADLALSLEEARELLVASGAELSPDAVVALHDLTRGWITGLLLAARSGAQVLHLGGDGPADGRLFEYLAEEVLQRQAPEVREFLVQTAVFERFTPELAAAVTGRADAAEILGEVVPGHLLEVGIDGEQGAWYRFRSMFLSLLRRRLAERDRAWQGALHRRAAEAWLGAGEPEEAARHFLAADEPAAVVGALEPVAERMIAGNRGTTLARWLHAIPPELWSDSPGLVLAQASALFARAEFPQALDALERAFEELVESGDHERAAVAFFRYLRALALAGGKHDRALAAAERHLPRIDARARALAPARVVVGQLYAEALRYEDAEGELRAAAELAPAGDVPVVTAFADATRALAIQHAQGLSEAALTALERAIAQLERFRDEDRLYFLPFARAYRAVVLNDVGRFEAALAEAERLREACESRGLGDLVVPVVAWLRFEALAGLGRWSELGAELATHAPLFARIGSVARGYRFHVATARLAAENRDAATVAARIDDVRSGIRAHGHPFDEAMALGDVALCAWEVGLADQGRELAAQAHAVSEHAGAPWPRAKAAIAGALAHGPGAEGDALLAEALDLTERHSLLGLWTRGGRRVASRLLARAIARGLGPDGMAARLAVAAGAEVLDEAAELLVGESPTARARLVEAASGAPGAESAVRRLSLVDEPSSRMPPGGGLGDTTPRAPLRLVTLGGFAVLRDGVRIPDSEFERQKARALLALLLCAQGPVHRDALVETLWPDLPPDRGLAALNSTLYSLRRVLEPGLSRGTASSVIVSDGGTYRIVLTGGDEWDARRFLDLAARAVSAVPADLDKLLAAESLHVGQFLPEWAYEEWPAILRTEIQEAFAQVLARLAEGLAASGQPGAAISRYRRLLALEPEREGWHRALMRVYAQAGERALALRQYQACRAILRQRLGVEPSRETRALYADLLRDEDAPGG